MPPVPILGVARPTNDIEALRLFYVDGLGFEVLGTFADHDGFDGLMLGHGDWPYHLEFTHRRGHQVGMSPSNENLLVLKTNKDISGYKALLNKQYPGKF